MNTLTTPAPATLAEVLTPDVVTRMLDLMDAQALCPEGTPLTYLRWAASVIRYRREHGLRVYPFNPRPTLHRTVAVAL